ncbi:cytoplasmic tyrosine-protein kinase BMX isoform X2 [Paramormyrops kingsleyae]|uniref:cytoplasmic tyrosine-protein kinase BMX isoform X2 n=1 Tax=Paramormyrops kingsleyae TaxID=1676925 RepID=UPI003B97CC1D
MGKCTDIPPGSETQGSKLKTGSRQDHNLETHFIRTAKMEPSVVKAEVLMKMSQQKKRISPRNYKYRLFELTSNCITYYEYEKGKKGAMKGSVATDSICCVQTVQPEGDAPVQRQFPFQIVYDKGILYIFAKDEDSRRSWVGVLSEGTRNNAKLMETYHSGFYMEGRFLCCKQTSKASPGCTLYKAGESENPTPVFNKSLPPLPGLEGRDRLALPPIPKEMKSSPSLVDTWCNDATKPDLERETDDRWKVKNADGNHGGVAPACLQEAALDGNSLTESRKRLTKRSCTVKCQQNNKPKMDLSDRSISFDTHSATQPLIFPQSDNVEDYSWYGGNMSRVKSETLLQQMGKEGAFLVRDSSHKGSYTVSLFSLALNKTTGTVRHYLINTTDDKQFYLAENLLFGSIPKLISYHQLNGAGLLTRLRHPALGSDTIPSSGYGDWELRREEITLVRQLGSGQFGVVQLALWKGRCEIAVKTIKECSMSTDEFIEEAKIMMRLKHPKLVSLHGVCTEAYPFYIVTEYMENGNLLEYLKTHGDECPPSRLLDTCLDVCDAMCYLERQQFIHRDLAARNCLVHKNLTVKVSDFGMARYVMDDQYTSSAGTTFPVRWSAPEVLSYTRFSSKSDVWAFGVLMWEVYTLGKQPYEPHDNKQVAENVMRGCRLHRPQLASEKLHCLISSCWYQNPEDRPPFHQIFEDLQAFHEDRQHIDSVWDSSDKTTEVQIIHAKQELNL